MEDRVALLSQKPPSAMVPDPLVAQVPSLVSSLGACAARIGSVDQGLRGLRASSCKLATFTQANFKAAHAQILAQAQEIAALRGASERVKAKNERLAAQKTELGP